MLETICSIEVPKTPQELDQAIQRYRNTDLKGQDLFCQWQAIRDASLAQSTPDIDNDRVPGEDSY